METCLVGQRKTRFFSSSFFQEPYSKLTLIIMFFDLRNRGNDIYLIIFPNFRQIRQKLASFTPSSMKTCLVYSPLLTVTASITNFHLLINSNDIEYRFYYSNSRFRLLDYGRIQTSITAFKGKLLTYHVLLILICKLNLFGCGKK